MIWKTPKGKNTKENSLIKETNGNNDVTDIEAAEAPPGPEVVVGVAYRRDTEGELYQPVKPKHSNRHFHMV